MVNSACPDAVDKIKEDQQLQVAALRQRNGRSTCLPEIVYHWKSLGTVVLLNLYHSIFSVSGLQSWVL